MAFVIPVEVELCPPAGFLQLANATEKLGSYGWSKAFVDTKPDFTEGLRLASCRRGTVRFVIEGRPGATAESAVRDVEDAMSGVGAGARMVRAARESVVESITGTARAVGKTVGSGIGGLGEGAGLGGGPGVFTIGAIAVALAVAAGIAALVFSMRAGRGGA